MKKSAAIGVCLALLVTGALTASAGNMKSGQSTASYAVADLKRGGLLYDKWYRLTGSPPEGTHPAYPPTGRQSGANTWRCKECHGWDYRGKDGRYREGSHFTGIGGVFASSVQAPEQLYAALSNNAGHHDFSPYLSDVDRWALVKFIRDGVFDTTRAFPTHDAVAGNAAGGKALYGTHCASCHGTDGNGIDFKADKEGIQGVGWLARKNPQETLHKIRWGHPGSAMPSMVADAGLSTVDALDILAFCRELD